MSSTEALPIVALLVVIQFMVSASEDLALASRDYGLYGFLKIVQALMCASVIVIATLTL